VRRICSVCTGAFLLAAAGLLKGRRATTHWAAADRLAKEDCGALVDPEPIFIQDGRIWTSAGVTAGIDLALALIEEDMGYATAMSVARSMVVYLRRPGNQSQYSQVLSMQVASDRTFARLHAWVREHLAEDLSVEALAHQVGMSTRSLARHHKTRTGQSPARMVEAFRIEAAVHALEKGDLSLKQIARDCGFGDERTLRRVFLRRFGRAPLDYACGRRTTA
jgi:transcriptional regulator GlxA family with amidase domain